MTHVIDSIQEKVIHQAKQQSGGHCGADRERRHDRIDAHKRQRSERANQDDENDEVIAAGPRSTLALA
jgi:hypothetical protein